MKRAHRPLPRIFCCLLFLFASSSKILLAADTVELQPHFRTITLTGLTYPLQEITITSEVSGRCLKIAADVGDTIPEAGNLAEIDTTFIRLDLEANRIAQDQATRQLTQEEKTLARYTTLLNQKSTPQARLDEAALAADLHRLMLQKLHNEEARLHEQLKRHMLDAPVGWQLIERYAEPGEFIQAGKPVARLGDFRRLLVPLALTYNELQSLMAIQDIDLYLPDIQTNVSAEIHRTSPVFAAATRKIPVELILEADQPDQPLPLRGGMRVELMFAGDMENTSFRIPRSALISRYEANWLMRPDTTRVQVIFLGYSEDNNFAIVSGHDLAAGQQFIAHPDKHDQH
jgi:RND family efflux transporter MFP subunit